MNRLSTWLMCGMMAAFVAGCGGVAEKPAQTTTPAADPDKIQKEKERMFEMQKMKGHKPKTDGADAAKDAKK